MNKYRVLLTKDAKLDIQETKKYIINRFHYREYAENFSKNIKKAVRSLDIFAEGHQKAGMQIQEYEVYYYPYSTYLIFYVIEKNQVTVIRILKDRMAWQCIIKQMKKIRN